MGFNMVHAENEEQLLDLMAIWNKKKSTNEPESLRDACVLVFE